MPSTPATWTWMLCDASGNALAELATAAGRRITFKRNTYAEAQFTLSHADTAATLLWNAVRGTGMPTLRCYRKPGTSAVADPAPLRFNGYLAPFTENAEDESTLSLIFRSPFGRVIGDGSNSGRFLVPGLGVSADGAPLYYPAGTDAGQIGKGLLDIVNADSPTGLATTGTIEASALRERTYKVGQNVGRAIVSLTEVLDGFDFTERFVEAGSTLALFDVAAHLGTDKPAVRFEYGGDTLANVRGMSRTTQPPVNVVYVAGANGLMSTAIHAASIAKYGKWPAYVTASETLEQATLDTKATALLRPLPTRIVSFAADPALAPLAWDDFFLGDTVRFFARRAALTENVAVRVNSFTVVIDEEGREAFEVPDPTTPDEESSIRASLSVEVVDG